MHDYREHWPEHQAGCPFNPANRPRRWWVILLAFLLSCGNPFDVRNPRPFHPPASYRVVWDSAQACTGIHKRFEVLHFMVAERIVARGQIDAGHADGTTVWLQEGYLDHPMVVKHEMIHVLLMRGGHPDPPFANPCHATWRSWHGGPDLVMTP